MLFPTKRHDGEPLDTIRVFGRVDPKDEFRMGTFSRIFRHVRLLTVLALLLSANAPLMHYACGATGEAVTTSAFALAVEDGSMEPALCGVVAEGVHDLLCAENQATNDCQGASCSSENLEKQSVANLGSTTAEIDTAPSPGPALFASSSRRSFSSTVPQAKGTDDTSHPISVRLRTLSFLL